MQFKSTYHISGPISAEIYCSSKATYLAKLDIEKFPWVCCKLSGNLEQRIQATPSPYGRVWVTKIPLCNFSVWDILSMENHRRLSVWVFELNLIFDRYQTPVNYKHDMEMWKFWNIDNKMIGGKFVNELGVILKHKLLSFLSIEMTFVVEIRSHGREGPVYPSIVDSMAADDLAT